MCNASNHPPDCKCGWGPRDSIGALTGVGFEWTRSIKSYESFVNPNARCPKCQKKTYFYRSPDGGSVYFDQLGPPWTKHPCMISSLHKAADPEPNLKAGFIMQCPPPNEEGWRPLKPTFIRREFDTFYVKVDDDRFPGNYICLVLPLAGCSPIYWRLGERLKETHVEVSLLDRSKFGDIKIWSGILPVAVTLKEARELRASLIESFKAT